MIDGEDRWLDRDAGRVVRPYALTRGRTRPPGATLGLIDQVSAAGPLMVDAQGLGPERTPTAIADLASEIDLPLGVVRVLLGDLLDRGAIVVAGPATADSSDESVLRSVLDGLRAL